MPFAPPYPPATPLEGDGIDYEVLAEAARSIKDVAGLTCDIGVRTGGSTKIIVDELEEGRTHIGIDPYGGIDYPFDNGFIVDNAYPSEEYRNPSLPKIYEYVFSAGVNFQFYNMTSAQFMRRFWDGVPTYIQGVEAVVNNYALIYFDGCHTLNTVMSEAVYFEWRTITGSMFVFDDIDSYDHDVVHKYLSERGWAQVARTSRKVSYRKESPA
jgi:hypothetical protein